MCVYKSDVPSFFSEALDSIIFQSIDCDIFIYQDGLLPLELLNVLSFYKSKYSNRLFVFCSNENNGLAYGLNFLIEKALEHEYDFIARMDSDDYSYSNRLKRQVEYLSANLTVDILGTACREFGTDFSMESKVLPSSHDDLIKFSVSRCPFIHPTVMFRSSVFKNGIRYPINTTFTEDMALWYSLIINGFTLANIDDILLDYRMTNNTICRRKGISKSISEFSVRYRFMREMKLFSIYNFLTLIVKFLFHISPRIVMVFAYKNFR